MRGRCAGQRADSRLARPLAIGSATNASSPRVCSRSVAPTLCALDDNSSAVTSRAYRRLMPCLRSNRLPRVRDGRRGSKSKACAGTTGAAHALQGRRAKRSGSGRCHTHAGGLAVGAVPPRSRARAHRRSDVGLLNARRGRVFMLGERAQYRPRSRGPDDLHRFRDPRHVPRVRAPLRCPRSALRRGRLALQQGLSMQHVDRDCVAHLLLELAGVVGQCGPASIVLAGKAAQRRA